VRALDRKLLRDLRRARGQVLTTALVVACGVAAFTSMMGTYRALRGGQAEYYERTGFPHVFAGVRRAPEAIRERLAALPDVAQAETRVVVAARFDLQGLPEPASGRLVSLPPDGVPGVPAVTLISGRLPEGRGEALALESFALAQGLRPGDRVPAIAEGRRLELVVTGLAHSPEYVVAFGEGYYQPGRFGVFWLRREVLAAEVGLAGAFNDVTLRLRPGADLDEAIAGVDRLLERWGGAGAYGRREQASHRALDGELAQLEGLAVQIPLLFLLVQAFLLHVILGRFVRAQREQIAVLKAVGYRGRTLAVHFLGFAAAIVVLGCVLGVALGAWTGGALVELYASYFRLPALALTLDAPILAAGAGSAAVAAFAGAIGSVRAVTRMAPAEAMRPPVPATYRRGTLSRLGLYRAVTHTGRMVVRELTRRPSRLLLSSAGLAMGIGLLVVGRFQADAVSWYLDVDLAQGMPADAMVTLSRPLPARTVLELRLVPGVTAVETTRAVPVRVSRGHRARRLALQTVHPGAGLWRVMQLDGRAATFPRAGIALGRSLADVLHAREGDRVIVERLDAVRDVLELPVTAIVEDLHGNTAFIDDGHLHRLLGEEPVASAAYLAIDPGRLDDASAGLRASPWVTSVTSRRSIIETFLTTTGSYNATMTLILVGFGGVLAVGITYNNARIAVAERGRDLATLRVVGYTKDEVSSILLGELAAQLLLAIPLGILLGNLLARGVMATVDPELYRWPLVIYPRTYAFAVLTVLGAGVLSALLVRRKLDRLDLTEALKARD
jgi:putative ABC transport system permease protein